MPEQLLDTLLDILSISNFNKFELSFLLYNQNNFVNFEFTSECIRCESFFIRFVKLFNSNKYYIYVNIDCICIYNNIVIFNISYFYAI